MKLKDLESQKWIFCPFYYGGKVLTTLFIHYILYISNQDRCHIDELFTIMMEDPE